MLVGKFFMRLGLALRLAWIFLPISCYLQVKERKIKKEHVL